MTRIIAAPVQERPGLVSTQQVPNGDAMTLWVKTSHELYDEGEAKFDAAKSPSGV
jgi:hypothetical protein